MATTTSKRLNLFEYNNALRTLLGVENPLHSQFPPDPIQEGFDNMAGSLSFSPQLLALFFKANQLAITEAFQSRPRYQKQIEAETLRGGGLLQQGWGFELYSNTSFVVDLPQEEAIQLTIQAAGSSYGSVDGRPVPLPILVVLVDDQEIGRMTIEATLFDIKQFSFDVTMTPGKHTITLQNTNRASSAAGGYGNSLVLDWMKLSSIATLPGAGFNKLPACPAVEMASSDERRVCYQQRILTFANRAFGGLLMEEDKQSLLDKWHQAVGKDSDMEQSYLLLLQTILNHPKFLFHLAIAGEPVPDQPHLVWQHPRSLIAKLSFLLFGTLPEPAMLAQADSLRTAEGRHAYLDKLFDDSHLTGLVKGFGAQWLGTRTTAHTTIDPAIFPNFANGTVEDMVLETESMLQDILKKRRPITQLLRSDESWLTDKLAEHYGLPLPGSSTPVAAPLQGLRAGGFLSHGSWLIAHGSSARTSPVRRGKFLVEQLLCGTIAPPPPGVPILEPVLGSGNPSARQQLLTHTTNPACQSCHQQMDDLGFAMDIYDPVGLVRDQENGHAIDASGVFPGTSAVFQDTASMIAVFQQDERFIPCVARKVWTYSLGRSVTAEDEPTLQEVIAKWQQTDLSIQALLHLIIDTPQFLYQLGD